MNEVRTQFDGYESFENEVGRKDRYRYAKAERGDTFYFIKQAMTEPEQENLRRELVWADFMQTVETAYPDLHIHALRNIKLLDDNTLVSEWVEAPLVSQPRDAAAWRKNITRYTDMLVALDTVAESYIVPTRLRTYNDRVLHERLDFWLRHIDRTPLIDEAYEMVIRQQPAIRSVMQHGDLTPWQIFDAGEDWIIIDGERSGDDLPRFNDVAYSYGRLAARCNDPETAEQMLGDFITARGLSQEVVEEQLRPVLLFRLLGMLGDAAEDTHGTEYKRVERILQRCVHQPFL